MDWLTFKFCVLIWVLCVSKSKSQSQLLNSTSSLSNQLRSACEDGQPIVPPDECNTCICFASIIYCTNTPCPEQECVNGVDLPQPDACNKCICRRGKVTCSNMICIPAPNCTEKQLYPPQNKCNACMCIKGFITCTSNPCAEEPLTSTMPTTTTKKPKKKKKCKEGESLPGPGPECIECICQNGRRRCKNSCVPTMESRFGPVESFQISEPECFPGQHLPRPDECNNCICFEGQVHCTHLPCRMDTRIGLDCTDNQLVFRPDECNECYCFEGRLECSDLVCIRGSQCVQGQVIPKPDSCNACKCIEGHILCTDYQCPALNSKNPLRPGRFLTEEITLAECQVGDIISPPPPPNDCNTCYCMDNRILCSMNSCGGSDPEIKGRQREPNEQTVLEIFDKPISVQPFINMLSKNYEKLPSKLIHTHAYNGFHQEIKVHASHLPKDATKLLKDLAISLDNSALASISQRLLTSSNSLSNNHDSQIPLDNQVAPTTLLSEGNVLTTQSNKLITSGSQSNETILVIPNTEPFDGKNSQSALPLKTKHETIWKSVSSPASLVFNNNQQINPHSSQDEKLNVNYDNPPSKFMFNDQNNVIRNPSKLSPPGFTHNILPKKPTRNIVEIPNTNTQSIYPASNPKSNYMNDGKIRYVPFSQENKRFKPIPSGFVFERDELPDPRPYQLIKPSHNQLFNYTPIFRPGKFIVTPNNNGGQQKPSQSQFIPNLSKYYPNHVKPQKNQFKPNQNHLPTLNNKGVQHPPLFPTNLNQPIVAANQYKQPPFGLKSGHGSVSPLNNKGNQTDQQFKAFHPNFQTNPPLIKLPNQKKRIYSLSNEVSKEKPPQSMIPNSAAHHTNVLNPPQIGDDPEHTQHKSPHSQFVQHPFIDYENKYEAPKISDLNPGQEQLIPHSKISYTHTEDYNPPHTSSDPGFDTLIPKVRNKTKKYNTSHSHYEKHTTITYISEYDPTHPARQLQIVHDRNQYQNAPQTNVYKHYLPDQESQELDLTMSKVNYYLNLPNLQFDQNERHPKLTHYYSSQISFFPGQKLNYTLKVHPNVPESNKYNQHDSWNITNDHFDTSASDGNNTDPHSSSQYQFILSKDNSNKGSLNDPKSAEGPQSQSNSAEDPTHPKSNELLPPPSQTGPTQNQHPPGLFDDRGSTNRFQYTHNAYEDPRQLKPVHKLLLSKLETPQNHQLPGFFDDRGSADVYEYPSNSAEDIAHPKVKLTKSPQFDPYTPVVDPEQPKDNIHISPHSQFGPTQKQHKPGVFDNHEVKDEFQYAHNADKNPTYLKPLHKLLPFPHSHTPFGPTLIQNSTGMVDERGSADGFHYPPNFAESLLKPKDNQHNPPHPQFGIHQNEHTPGVFDDLGSADGFHYPSNSAEKSTHPKNNPNTTRDSNFKQPQNQSKPSSLDDGYNSKNSLRPWMHLDHDQYKPSFDNLLNGVLNIPWSFSGDYYKDSNIVTSAPEPRFTPDFDQYKPIFFDNLFNGIHQIPWSVPSQDNNGLESDTEITTPHSGFKPKPDQYGPSMVNNTSISNQNQSTDLTDVDDNQSQIEQDVSTPSTKLTDSDDTQYNLLPKLKPDSDPDNLLLTDNGKIPDYYEQLYPLFKAVKKLSPPIDDSIFSVGSMDQLDLLPFLFPGIAKILNYVPSQDNDHVSPDENHEVQRINPLSKLKSKLKQLPENNNGILNWLKSKLLKLVRTKDNATLTKNDIDMTKIFNLLYKLTLPKLKHTTALQNIPFSGFDPEIIENITNQIKEDTLTTTSTPRTNSSHSYGNRFKSVSTIPEESRPQAPQSKYPDVHIILHQPNDEDDVDLPPYIETDGELNLPIDIDSKELRAAMLPKMFNPRFRHRPKDQKDECGDGTQWISNCHGCSCYFGQAMCFRLPGCELRPLGEPMICKPYSHFKMGCYTCECNGDGVAECDATDCNKEPSGKSKGSTESPLPLFNELFDNKKTNEILQYYNFYMKMPKDCPKHDLQTQYPTCEPGTSWVSSCYKCECNECGKHECIKIDDCKLDFDSYGKPGRCKPNSKFYPKTNSMPCVECSCNDEGISYCPEADYKKH